MRVARVARGDTSSWAVLEGTRARALRGSPFDAGSAEPGALTHLVSDDVFDWAEADLRAPVRPSKIVCVGRNYAAHAKELGHDVPSEPLLFFKPPSSLLDPGGDVVLREESERVEHEAELGVVIGRRASRVSREDALSYVFGYTCVCDVTARDLQKKDGQWARAKGFDTFCPVGPWIETELDPRDLEVKLDLEPAADRGARVVRQLGRTSQMLFDVPTLVAYVSRVFTLEPGDLIATGTPEGVGLLAAGDAVHVSIEGIGALSFGVAPSRP